MLALLVYSFPYLLSEIIVFMIIDLLIPFVIHGLEDLFIIRLEIGFSGACLFTSLFTIYYLLSTLPPFLVIRRFQSINAMSSKKICF